MIREINLFNRVIYKPQGHWPTHVPLHLNQLSPPLYDIVVTDNDSIVSVHRRSM